MCLAGASGAGAELLEAMPDAGIRAHVVWVPMLPTDEKAAALAASERFAEPRAAHYWDAERHLSRRMATALGVDTRRSAATGDDPPFAWDVYLLYGRGNREVGRPDFWMHQLAVDHAPRFEAGEWRRRIQALIDEGA